MKIASSNHSSPTGVAFFGRGSPQVVVSSGSGDSGSLLEGSGETTEGLKRDGLGSGAIAIDGGKEGAEADDDEHD